MDLAQYTACDATELRSLIASVELDSEEMREAALRAIEAVEGDRSRRAALVDMGAIAELAAVLAERFGAHLFWPTHDSQAPPSL